METSSASLTSTASAAGVDTIGPRVHGGRRGVREQESGSLGQLGVVSEAGVKQALGSCQLQACFTRGVPIPA